MTDRRPRAVRPTPPRAAASPAPPDAADPDEAPADGRPEGGPPDSGAAVPEAAPPESAAPSSAGARHAGRPGASGVVDQIALELEVPPPPPPVPWGAEGAVPEGAQTPVDPGMRRALRNAAEADAWALMALFYFRRILDHQALSFICAQFRPLRGFFDLSEDQVRRFFARRRYLRGVVDAATLASSRERDAAFRYAEARITPDGRFTDRSLPGALLTAAHPRFPARLRRSRLPVDWLFCYPGPPTAPLPGPVVAIIGSRESAPEQLEAAREVANLVGYARGTVITGLATGADGAAHEAAAEGEASLVAVLGSGARRPYPAEHARWVLDLIRGRGVVLTETPPDGAANADSFVLRNRIVAGLADIVVPVSGKYASGTAHTVRFAADMGVRLVSADPAPNSGMTRLVRELGGEHLSPRALAEGFEQHGG